ncbi:hypothetical protein DPV78_001396 [Talaromyces pinophilus]|jgi:hypothetical protein|nr:hypothetical protein DPV78_001396 [Talaromyces pinophilus]
MLVAARDPTGWTRPALGLLGASVFLDSVKGGTPQKFSLLQLFFATLSQARLIRLVNWICVSEHSALHKHTFKMRHRAEAVLCALATTSYPLNFY